MRIQGRLMENSGRLIAFGCSQTYGHCLPDCYVENDTWDGIGIADNPSKFAFPAIVGAKLNRETVNLSYPGCSNKYIWHTAVNYNFLPNDIVIFAWTLPNRSMVVTNKDNIEHVGMWPSVDRINKSYQHYVGVSNSDINLEIEAWHFMDHAHRLIKPKVKTILHYCLVSMKYENRPAWAEVDFQAGFESVVKPRDLDYALDNAHYGLRSHRVIAKRIMQDLAIAPSSGV